MKKKKESKFDKFCIKSNEWYKELNPLLMLLVFTILFHIFPYGEVSTFTVILVGITLTLCRLLCISAVFGEFIGYKKKRIYERRL